MEKAVKPARGTNLLQTDDSNEDLSAQLAKAVATVTRNSPDVASMQDSLSEILVKLKGEESKDAASVNVHTSTAETKASKLANAKAAEETRFHLLIDAKAERDAANAALAEQQKRNKDSSVVIQNELDKLEQVSQELDQLIAVRAGSEEMELLQTDSSTFGTEEEFPHYKASRCNRNAPGHADRCGHEEEAPGHASRRGARGDLPAQAQDEV